MMTDILFLALWEEKKTREGDEGGMGGEKKVRESHREVLQQIIEYCLSRNTSAEIRNQRGGGQDITPRSHD